MDAQPTDLQILIAPETAEHARAVDALVERAFGPGRYAKAAERLREGNTLRADLSFTAVAAGEVVGCIRQWPVMVGAARGVFLGPIAVEGGWRKHGIGADLIACAVAAAEKAGEAFILLVGDKPLFVPHGFVEVPRGLVQMPGPVDPARVMWQATRTRGLDDVAGLAHLPDHV